MRKTVSLTIDIEHDCPPYLKTYRGIEKGLPGLCSVLDGFGVKATFFVTGDVASKYPEEIKKIAQHHEIGSHGYSHKRFDRMNFAEAAYEIEKSTEILCRLTGKEKLDSFRAPNLVFPERFLYLLKDNGYSIDSSIAKYKPGWVLRRAVSNIDILRVPVSATSSLLRFPFGNQLIRRLSHPVVLFFHPWEFVGMQHEPIRCDCRINTGAKALSNLEKLIEMFKSDNYRFCKMSDFLK
ncbi:MAG: polysaccharide deacetylase [Candidatus Methanoperedens sp.]|nr:polysaccharide deacetylase [Candidatus Methanoperedens sp.]